MQGVGLSLPMCWFLLVILSLSSVVQTSKPVNIESSMCPKDSDKNSLHASQIAGGTELVHGGLLLLQTRRLTPIESSPEGEPSRYKLQFGQHDGANHSSRRGRHAFAAGSRHTIAISVVPGSSRSLALSPSIVINLGALQSEPLDDRSERIQHTM